MAMAYAFTAFFTFLPPPTPHPLHAAKRWRRNEGREKAASAPPRPTGEGQGVRLTIRVPKKPFVRVRRRFGVLKTMGPNQMDLGFFFGLVDSLGHGPSPAPGPPGFRWAVLCLS